MSVLMPQHFIYFHFETFVQKIQNIYNIFSKNLFFLIVSFLSILETSMISCMWLFLQLGHFD